MQAAHHSCGLQKQDRMQNKSLGYKRMRKIMVRQAYKMLDNIFGTEQKILLFLELSAVPVNGAGLLFGLDFVILLVHLCVVKAHREAHA